MTDWQVITGDCAAVMATFEPDSIDLTVTSPPYDNLRKYNGYHFDFEAIAAQLWRVTKPGGVVVWGVADATINGSETGTSFRQALHFMGLGFNMHDTMIYAKENIGMYDPRNGRYKSAHEYMFVFSKGTVLTYNPIKDRPTATPGRNLDRAHGRKPSGELRRSHMPPVLTGEFQDRFNIWHYRIGNNLSAKDTALKHPGAFPEALARDHIISWSNPGDVVLDPMCGSGTTGKQAVLLGRRFIGIDISAEYVEGIARPRIAKAAEQARQLELPIE